MFRQTDDAESLLGWQLSFLPPPSSIGLRSFCHQFKMWKLGSDRPRSITASFGFEKLTNPCLVAAKSETSVAPTYLNVCMSQWCKSYYVDNTHRRMIYNYLHGKSVGTFTLLPKVVGTKVTELKIKFLVFLYPPFKKRPPKWSNYGIHEVTTRIG